MTRTGLQRIRAWTQVGFFSLFLLAPPLDILRIDLTQGHAILLGQAWRSLELWIDAPAPVEVMRAALDTELGGSVRA